MYRNRGGTYLLDKKEVKAGHDPEKELNNGFQDVGRIDDDNDDPDIEKISLSESVKNYYDSDDDPTGEYEGDLDTSKFNEEDRRLREHQ
ncbi:uncharacterized protein LOC132747517 isoform X2 [Ruditapes philippinarum]|uniref:uncharacterized protein LOC132747517 isoform X2 n=1 Tax=Ruditapes philippinarum TaxID=129788 RepID=UPI00295B6B8A|nr:uncharacterized protein LOC132747517 isoform X2 [Ruditapes philippinarum]